MSLLFKIYIRFTLPPNEWNTCTGMLTCTARTSGGTHFFDGLPFPHYKPTFSEDTAFLEKVDELQRYFGVTFLDNPLVSKQHEGLYCNTSIPNRLAIRSFLKCVEEHSSCHCVAGTTQEQYRLLLSHCTGLLDFRCHWLQTPSSTSHPKIRDFHFGPITIPHSHHYLQ